MRLHFPATALVIAASALLAAGGSIASASATPLGVHRIAGADRYEVSAAISADTFPGPMPVPVAYVVSGEVFADALSASALAGLQGGPVLLTMRTAVPDAIKAELSRIDPVKIVVLGGTAAISDEVHQELRRFSPNVTRIGGADRYEVSAAAARSVMGAGVVPVSFVASGENFPDALSGAAAAGHLGGPVVLTRKEQLPLPVAAELTLERPGAIRVLGGPVSISETVVSTLKTDIQPATTRITGADRYVVSAAISQSAFGSASTVYIASGQAFPDALSGSAAAIANEASLLLVTKSSIPAEIATELKRLKPTKIVVLGGTAAIDEAVVSQLSGFLAP